MCVYVSVLQTNKDFVYETTSVKESKVSIPKAALGGQVLSREQRLHGAAHSCLQAGALSFSALLHLIIDIYRFLFFFLWREPFISVVWEAAKVYNRRYCCSRWAILSCPQGYPPNGERCHLIGLCMSFSQHMVLLFVSLGRVGLHS